MPTAKWKIRLEMTASDGYSAETTSTAEISGQWEHGSRPILECFALDIGAAAAAIRNMGHVLGAGQMGEAFSENTEEGDFEMSENSAPPLADQQEGG